MVAEERATGVRDRILASLHSIGIDARAYFSPLSSTFPHYRGSTSVTHSLVHAESAARRTFCLPFHGGVSARHVSMIGRIISNHLNA